MSSPKRAGAKTYKDVTSVQRIADDVYETHHAPEPMGDALPFAYGGTAFTSAIIAAYQTLPSNTKFHLYSTSGYYMGPGLTDKKLRHEIKRLRDTRTFATRFIEIYNDLGEKGKRKVMIITADFQAAEPSLLEFSARPSKAYAMPDKQLTAEELYQSYVDQGKITQEDLQRWRNTFRLVWRYFEQKPCEEGVFAQNLEGISKKLETTQDHLSMTEKSSADWFRCREKLTEEAEHLAAIIFVMDGALAYMPLAHNRLSFEDSAVCASLDFAMRIFRPDVDMNAWHLREMKTIAAAGGRTYSEGRLWDLQGNMIASMTQQCILRPNSTSKI